MSDKVNEQTIESIRESESWTCPTFVTCEERSLPPAHWCWRCQTRTLLSALDAQREQTAADERALTEVRAERDEAQLKLRIYENGRNVNQPLVDDIERWRVESEAAIGKAQQSRLNAMMERDTLAAELRTLRDERETMSIKLWALVKKWREDAQKLGRDSEQEGVGDPRASRLYGQLLAIGWAANNLEALLNDPKPAAAPSAEGGKA